MNSIISLPRRTKTYRFRIASVDCRKRFENACVDEDICIRFRCIKNGDIRKRINVDVALVCLQCLAAGKLFRARNCRLAHIENNFCLITFLSSPESTKRSEYHKLVQLYACCYISGRTVVLSVVC